MAVKRAESNLKQLASRPASAVLLCTLVIASCVLCNACGWRLIRRPRRIRGSGEVVTETRPVSGVTGVELRYQGDLFVEMGDEAQLVIVAEDNLIEHIETEVVDGALVLAKIPDRVTLYNQRPIRYHLTVPSLEALTTTSSGNIEASRLQAEHVSIRVTSSGYVQVDRLDAKCLDVRMSSSGDVAILDGQVTEQNITISSSGRYDASGLQSRRANARLSSSGEATIHVLERLEADLSSSGDIYCSGSPTVVAPPSSSTGKVRRIP